MQGISNRRKLASDSLWSIAGNIATAVAGLATVRIVANWVNSDAYGQASLLLGLIALLNGLLMGPLLVVHLRLYFDYLERGLARWYASVFKAVLLGAALGASALYGIVASIYALHGEWLYLEHAALVVLVILVQPFLSALTNYLEAHREQRRLAILNVLNRALYPCLVLCLLGVAIAPTDAVVAAQGLAALCVLSLFRTPKAQGASDKVPIDRKLEIRKLKGASAEFGWSLPAGYLAMWLVTTSDRYLLQHFTTLADVGLYAMNYALWSMPFVLLNGWLEVLTRPLIFHGAAKGEWPRVRRVLKWRMLVGLMASLGGGILLYLLAEWMGKILLGDTYWVSKQLVLTIALAHCLYVIGYSIVPLFLAAKQTKVILAATLIAGLCNLIVNWFAIPAFGLIGAAGATLCAYLLWTTILAIGGNILMRRLAMAPAS